MSDLKIEFGADSGVKEMQESLKKGFNHIQEKFQQHDDERAKLGTATAETKEFIEKALKDHGDKIDGFNAKIKQLEADAKAAEMRKANHREKRQTISDALFKSMGYDKESPKGFDAYNLKGKSYKLDGSFFSTKSFAPDLVSDNDGSAGQIVDLTRDPNFYRDPDRQLSMRDIIPNIPISGGVLEIMRQSYFGEEESSSTAEAKFGNAGYQTTQLTSKNKSQINYELVQYSPATMADFIVASTQSFEDVTNLRADINGRLLYSVRRFANNQILNGAGTAGTLEGINTVARNFVAPTGQGDRNVIDVIRDAMTQLNAEDYFATHIVLNTVDWGNIETLKVGDDDRRYVLGDPGAAAAPRMWGLPVVPQNDQPAGTFLVGNFALGSQLRPVIGSAQIRFTDSHDDLFIKNGIVVLAEERMIQANHLPNAYVSGDFPEES